MRAPLAIAPKFKLVCGSGAYQSIGLPPSRLSHLSGRASLQDGHGIDKTRAANADPTDLYYV